MQHSKKEDAGHNGLTRREFIRDTSFVLGGVALGSFAFLNGCKSGAAIKQPGSSTVSNPTGSNPSARTGSITTGAKVDAATQSVGPSGGYIAVSKAGDPLDGFVINLLPNSYADSRNFKVSYAPIINHTFGSDINPVSPLISVDNGGDYSDIPAYVRVPVAVPAGSFAMGFIYDSTTKQLEGMPLISSDSDSVTVGTRHFSDFFISMISKALLKDDIDSHFQPGKDDWQFINRGSYIAQGGHCEGQSLAALWYYCTRPDGANARLYGRYDNNGDQPATPDLWQDDSLGYRFCSVVHKDTGFFDDFWDAMNGKANKLINNKWTVADVPGLSDETQWNLFAYSMQATGEPQMVGIFSKANEGHVMICYRINQGNLYVADPNYPGDTTRRILYTPGVTDTAGHSSDGKFQPYSSGANKDSIDAGQGILFTNIGYYAKTTVLSWHKMDERWAELKDKTIGDDYFPQYQIAYKNDNGEWVELPENFQTPYASIYINYSPAAPGPFNLQIFSGNELANWDAKGNLDLNPGENKFGIYVRGKVPGQDANGNPITFYKYIDFQYVSITYNATTTAAAGGSISVKGQKTNSVLPQGAFGTSDNPYQVEISGKLKGDPGLQFEGVEYYKLFGTWQNVMAFVWSVPKPPAVVPTGTTPIPINNKLGADGLSIKFGNPDQTEIISGGTTTTWQGWSNGGALVGASVITWSNGGSITRDLIAQMDTGRSGENKNSITAAVDTMAIQLNAKINVSTKDGATSYICLETVVIRLVQR